MSPSWRRPSRYLVLALFAAGCGTDSCSCLQPLDGPLPKASLTSQAVQARVTPQGLAFVGEKLPSLVGQFVSMACDGMDGIPCAEGQTCTCPAGQTCQPCPANDPYCVTPAPRMCQGAPGSDPKIGFRVPASESGSTAICLESIGANWWNCVIHATLRSATLAPKNDHQMEIRMQVDISTPPAPNGILIQYDPPLFSPVICEVYPTVTDRTVTGTLDIGREARTDRMTMEVSSVDAPFSGDDLTIEGGWLCDVADWGFIKNWVVGSFASDLGDQIKGALNDALAPVRTQACTPYATGYQCPARPGEFDSVCVPDDKICHFSAGAQEAVPGLLGVEGQVDLSTALPAILSGKGLVQVSVYAGGTKADGSSAAYFADNSIYLGVVGGAYAEPNPCVAPRQRPTTPVPTYAFPATIAPASGGNASPYMVGLAAHTRLLNDVLGEAYSAGLLCQDVTSHTVGLLHSGIIGLLLGEGAAIDNLIGQSAPPRPVILELHPRAAPDAQIGLGTQGPDPADATRTLLTEPLLTLSVPELDIDVYVMVDDRYLRLLTLSVDLAVGLGLELNAQGQVHVVGNPVDQWIRAVRAKNADAMVHSPEEIAAAVPELLAAFLPQFAPKLDQVVDLPSMQGFSLQNVRFRGVQPLTTRTVLDKDRYDFLGVFADLAYADAAAAPSSLRLHTEAALLAVDTPRPEDMSTARGDQRQRVRAHLALATTAPAGLAVEHSYRIDGGLWHPYHRGPVLTVADPELNLQGWHVVDVRARAVGLPGSLDEQGVSVNILSDAEAPVLEAQRLGNRVQLRVEDRVTPAQDLAVRVRLGGGAWVAVDGGADRQVDVSGTAADLPVDVEVTDEAGHVTRKHLGAESAAALSSSAAVDSCGGCSAAGSTPPFLLALALLGLARRRPASR